MLDTSKLEQIHEDLITEYLDKLNKWVNLNDSELYNVVEDERLLSSLEEIRKKLDVIGVGIQLFNINQEIQRHKSGIIIPEHTQNTGFKI